MKRNLLDLQLNLLSNFISFESFRKTMKQVPQGNEKVLIILQHINVKFHQQKANQRSIGSFVVSSLFVHLDSETQLKYISYLTRLSKNTKSNHRLFAVEISNTLLDLLLEMKEISQLVKDLIYILIGRSSDKTNTVRTKSLNSLVSVLEKAISNETIAQIMIDIFSSPSEEEEEDQEESEIGGFIGQRLHDVSPGVRKAALQFVECMIQLDPKKFLKSKFLNIFVLHSSDESLSNRKQTVISLSKLSETFPEDLEVRISFLGLMVRFTKVSLFLYCL
jgi:hypothetical protein